MEATGLRRSELLRLKINCVQKHPISGYYLEWFDYKKQKKHRMPINNVCVDAINRLLKETAKLMAYGMSKCKSIESITDYSKIRIGSSVFIDDTWDLTQFINTKSLVNAMKKINFGYIESLDIKHTTKLYAYYLLGKNNPRTVKNGINGELPIFIEYSSINGITSFSQIMTDIFLDFAMWVKNTKNYNSKFGYMCSHVLEDIIRIGQVRGWDVPKNDVLAGVRACDIWDEKNYAQAIIFSPFRKVYSNKFFIMLLMMKRML